MPSDTDAIALLSADVLGMLTACMETSLLRHPGQRQSEPSIVGRIGGRSLHQQLPVPFNAPQPKSIWHRQQILRVTAPGKVSTYGVMARSQDPLTNRHGDQAYLMPDGADV